MYPCTSPPSCLKSSVRLENMKNPPTSYICLPSNCSSNTTPVCVKKKMRKHTLRVESQDQLLTEPSPVTSGIPSLTSTDEPGVLLPHTKNTTSIGICHSAKPQPAKQSSLARFTPSDSRSIAGSKSRRPDQKPSCITFDASFGSTDSPKSFDGMMDDIWNDLDMPSNNIVGFQMDTTSDSMEPIPYCALIAGVPVEVDDASSAAASTILSPFGMTHEQFLSAKVSEDAQQAPPIRLLRGKTLISIPKPQDSPEQSTRSATHKRGRSTNNKPTRKRKNANTSFDDDDKCNAAEDSEVAVVGPDSWQMMVLYRMIIFLEETNGCENIEHARLFRYAVAHCKAQYRRGHPKYLHLPGAVFEEVVDRIGGPAFLNIFKGAKTFEHPRLNEAFSDNEIVVVGTDETLRAIDITDGQPNLLQVSVAYGFHLAKTMKSSNCCSSVKEVLERGAHDVLNLDKPARKDFWDSQTASENQDPTYF